MIPRVRLHDRRRADRSKLRRRLPRHRQARGTVRSRPTAGQSQRAHPSCVGLRRSPAPSGALDTHEIGRTTSTSDGKTSVVQSESAPRAQKEPLESPAYAAGRHAGPTCSRYKASMAQSSLPGYHLRLCGSSELIALSQIYIEWFENKTLPVSDWSLKPRIVLK
jgi:hypothetical protein